jgi:hypothetical protein
VVVARLAVKLRSTHTYTHTHTFTHVHIHIQIKRSSCVSQCGTCSGGSTTKKKPQKKITKKKKKKSRHCRPESHLFFPTVFFFKHKNVSFAQPRGALKEQHTHMMKVTITNAMVD